MQSEQHLLLIKQLPPELAKRLEGTDPNVIDIMTIQHSLLERQTEIIRSGASYIPSLAELFEKYYGDKITPQSL